MPRNDLAYKAVSFDLGYYKAVASGLSTFVQAGKGSISEPVRSRRRRPRQGEALPQVSFCSRLWHLPPEAGAQERVAARAPEKREAGARAPVPPECCSSGCRLPGTGQLISVWQTQRPTRHGSWRDATTVHQCRAWCSTCILVKEDSPPVHLVPLGEF